MRNRTITLFEFSEDNEKLINFSNDLATEINSNLLLVHQTDRLIPSFTDAETKKGILEVEKKEAIVKINEIIDLKTHDIECEITEKNVVNYLESLHDSSVCDWVIVKQKEKEEFESFFTKSTILKIIEETNSLLIALPQDFSYNMPETLYFASHPKFEINHSQLEHLLNSLKNQVKKIVFFTHIDDEDNYFEIETHLKSLEELYQKYNTSTKIIVGNFANSDFKNQMDFTSSFLVVQKGPRNLFDLFFRRLSIDNLIKKAAFPLIIIPK